MKQSTRKYEQSFIRSRNAIEKKGVRLAKVAISEQYKIFLERAKDLPPQMWDDIKISEEPISRFFNQFYPMSAPLAQMTRKHMLMSKSLEDDLYLSVYEKRMQHLVTTKVYTDRITTITNTTKDRINTILKNVFEEAELGGFGVDKTRQLLIDSIGSNIRGNVRARAQGIAQTEMISASNQASTYAADSTGLEYRKFWSTSHLQNIRPSHSLAEQYSIQRGGLKPDEPFINGLMFPGDPSGSAEEVCNCRCTILHEII